MSEHPYSPNLKMSANLDKPFLAHLDKMHENALDLFVQIRLVRAAVYKGKRPSGPQIRRLQCLARDLQKAANGL